MKKSGMQEIFRKMLESGKEDIRHFVREENKQAVLICYGKICGYTWSMVKLGLIDYDQQRYIEDEAWALVQGKEPEYEPC